MKNATYPSSAELIGLLTDPLPRDLELLVLQSVASAVQREDRLLYCDGCDRSEIAPILDGGSDLLPIREVGPDGLLYCDGCEAEELAALDVAQMDLFGGVA